MSCTIRPPCLRGNSPRYSRNRRIGVPHRWSARFGEDKNILPLSGIEPRFLGRPARSVVTIPSTLFRLSIISVTYTIISCPCGVQPVFKIGSVFRDTPTELNSVWRTAWEWDRVRYKYGSAELRTSAVGAVLGCAADKLTRSARLCRW
jgi:hypothetical protein